MVKLYEPRLCEGDINMVEMGNGDWVSYEDYAALEDKLAAMQGLLLAAQDFAEFCRKRGVEDWGSDDN
ncbi:hypothetical protein GTL58_004364 [Salmonella enterica]|nr:hypothetical protein [Salmonella enterica]EIC4908519.1 hypothetical protein [Salmonella enterica]EIC6911796.1 hypothetical protein [Salmonella enterica subsp. enterica serovar Infantis]